MKYIGSKARLAKNILPYIEPELCNYDTYLEPFVGGCNMMDKIDHPCKVGVDGNKYLIAMWQSLRDGSLVLPDTLTKEEYLKVKGNKSDYPDSYLGFVGHNCSFSGDWFAGYAGTGEKRNRCGEAKRHLLKQIEKLKDVSFLHGDYRELKPKNTLIYCDPPYFKGFIYRGSKYPFNHEEFWDWCRARAASGCLLFISDYHAPDDFDLVLEIPHKVNAHQSSCKDVTERLYRIGGNQKEQK